MSINSRLKRSFVLSLACVGLLASASAQVISVNFQNPGGPIASGNATGLVSATNWNNIAMDNSSGHVEGTLGSLVDSDGATTGASLTYYGAGYQNASVSGGTMEDRQLLNNFIYGNSTHALSVTVSGLESVFSGAYDVNIYFTNANDFHVIGYTIGSTTYYTRTMGNFNFGSTGWVEGRTETLPTPEDSNDYLEVPQGNYVTFSNLIGGSFTIYVSNPDVNGSGFNYAAISGLQIVGATAVPEPATVALWLGAMVLGVVVLRRRSAR